MIHRGSCHCGAVSFTVEAPARLELLDCNCSMCRRLGYWHLIVPRDRFELLSGEGALREYRFGTGRARHLFCDTCGVKAFYTPRSHPDSWSVNARCLDAATVESTHLVPFDGANWEQAMQRLGED